MIVEIARNFKRQDLFEMVCGDSLDLELVDTEDNGTSRWSTLHTAIFRADGLLWMVDYSQGATEQQDEQPFQNEQDEVECKRCEAVEVMVVRYRKLPAGRAA